MHGHLVGKMATISSAPSIAVSAIEEPITSHHEAFTREEWIKRGLYQGTGAVPVCSCQLTAVGSSTPATLKDVHRRGSCKAIPAAHCTGTLAGGSAAAPRRAPRECTRAMSVLASI